MHELLMRRTTNHVGGLRVFVHPITKLLITGAWVVASAVPGALLFAWYGGRTGGLMLPFLWLACALLSVPAYGWMLGYVVDVQPEPTSSPRLEHLPRECARMVHESMAIRANVDDTKDALIRAWQLAQELDHAPPAIRELVQRYGATLEPVRQLLVSSKHGGRRSASDAQLSERLERALAAFEHALCQPRTAGFR